MSSTIKIIGKKKAEQLAEAVLKFSEDSLMPPLATEVRPHIVSQLAGIFKQFHLQPDGKYGHEGMERHLRILAHRESRKKSA